MQVLTDATVEGIANFLDEVRISKRLTLSDHYGGGSVQLFVPSNFDGFLGIGHGGTGTPYTAFHEGDVETCYGKLAELADKGFLRIGTTDGEPKGVPRRMGDGTPIVYDANSDSLYAYNGGWKQMVGGTKSVGYQSHTIAKWNPAGELVPSILIDTGHGTVYANGSLLPGTHNSGEHLGTSSRKWDSLHAHAVYTDLVEAPSLMTDKDGKIVAGSSSPGGGGTGNVETTGGTLNRVPVWLSSLKLGDSPMAIDGDHVVPANASVSTLGTAASKWGEVFADEVRIKYANLQYLCTNSLGQIRSAATPNTGAGWANRIAKYAGNGTVLTNSQVEDDGAKLTFHGSILPGTAAITVGTSADPWSQVHASNVYVAEKNAPVLATGSDGRIRRGSFPPVDPTTVYSGVGTANALAMFSSSNRIVDAPLVSDGADLVVGGRNLRLSSAGYSLGTASVPWSNVYATGITLGSPSLKNAPYLATNPNGDIVATSSPGGGGIGGGGVKGYVAVWGDSASLATGRLLDDGTGTVKSQAHFVPDGAAYALGSASKPWQIYCDVPNAAALKSVNGKITAAAAAASGTTNSLAMFSSSSSVGNAPATVSGSDVAFNGSVSASSVRIPLTGESYLGTDGNGNIVRGGSPEVQFRKISMKFPSTGIVSVAKDAIPVGMNATVVGAAVALPGSLQVYIESGGYATSNKVDAYTDATYASIFGWQPGDEVSILGKQNWMGVVTNWIDIVVTGSNVNIVVTGDKANAGSIDAGSIIGKQGTPFGLPNREMAGTDVIITLAVYS